MSEGSKIITGVAIADAIRPRLTIEGLRDMLQDMRAAGKPMPCAILVNEHERRDLNQDLLAGSIHEVAKADQRPEHDGAAIGIVEGVPIRSHPDVPRGNARLLFPDPKLTPRPEHKLGGEGLIMVGAR